MHAGTVEDHKDLIGTAERAVATGKEQMEKADAATAVARDRIAKLKRVRASKAGSGSRSISVKYFFRWASPSAIFDASIRSTNSANSARSRNCKEETHKRREQSERAALRAVRKRHGLDETCGMAASRGTVSNAVHALRNAMPIALSDNQ